jgi:hypothetical protein
VDYAAPNHLAEGDGRRRALLIPASERDYRADDDGPVQPMAPEGRRVRDC